LIHSGKGIRQIIHFWERVFSYFLFSRRKIEPETKRGREIMAKTMGSLSVLNAKTVRVPKRIKTPPRMFFLFLRNHRIASKIIQGRELGLFRITPLAPPPSCSDPERRAKTKTSKEKERRILKVYLESFFVFFDIYK
jgi:hypothetical protein